MGKFEMVILFSGIVSMILIFGVLIYFSIYAGNTTQCVEYVGILKSINGLTDKDTGLASGGDTSTTTLLFEDGLVITLRYRINKPVYLGKPLIIKSCIPLGGITNYRIL